MRPELARIVFVSILLAGCVRPDRTQNINVTPPSSLNGAPRYIPAERLPIRQEGTGFIRYHGKPSLEHLDYLRSVCGDINLSVQGPTVMIGTQVPDCEARVRSKRP